IGRALCNRKEKKWRMLPACVTRHRSSVSRLRSPVPRLPSPVSRPPSSVPGQARGELLIRSRGVPAKQSKLDPGRGIEPRSQLFDSEKEFVGLQREFSSVVSLSETIRKIAIQIRRASFDLDRLIDYKDRIRKIFERRRSQRPRQGNQILPTGKRLASLRVRDSRAQIAAEPIIVPMTLGFVGPCHEFFAANGQLAHGNENRFGGAANRALSIGIEFANRFH